MKKPFMWLVAVFVAFCASSSTGLARTMPRLEVMPNLSMSPVVTRPGTAKVRVASFAFVASNVSDLELKEFKLVVGANARGNFENPLVSLGNTSIGKISRSGRTLNVKEIDLVIPLGMRVVLDVFTDIPSGAKKRPPSSAVSIPTGGVSVEEIRTGRGLPGKVPERDVFGPHVEIIK